MRWKKMDNVFMWMTFIGLSLLVVGMIGMMFFG